MTKPKLKEEPKKPSCWCCDLLGALSVAGLILGTVCLIGGYISRGEEITDLKDRASSNKEWEANLREHSNMDRDRANYQEKQNQILSCALLEKNPEAQKSISGLKDMCNPPKTNSSSGCIGTAYDGWHYHIPCSSGIIFNQ